MGGSVLYEIVPGGRSCDRERCGMVVDRAAATGLPRFDERVRAAAAAAGEQQGQGRGDPRAGYQLLVLQRQLGPGRVQFTPRVTGRCWRHCCTGSRGTCSRDCTWWCARIPYSAGTAIWSRAGTPSGPGSGARGGRVPCARFVSWCCDWSARIPVMWSSGLCERARWPSLSWCLWAGVSRIGGCTELHITFRWFRGLRAIG